MAKSREQIERELQEAFAQQRAKEQAADTRRRNQEARKR